jgi:hypothetical protein
MSRRILLSFWKLVCFHMPCRKLLSYFSKYLVLHMPSRILLPHCKHVGYFVPDRILLSLG